MKMVKTQVRTFTVKIIDQITKAVLKEFTASRRPNELVIALDYQRKEKRLIPLTIDVTETVAVYGMPFDEFMNSARLIVEPETVDPDAFDHVESPVEFPADEAAPAPVPDMMDDGSIRPKKKK